MGKKGGASWFTAVKRAFRSPTKGSAPKTCKRREEDEGEDQDKRREKPKWIFRKATADHDQVTEQLSRDPITDQNHALAVAAATVAAAEAAAATAQAAARMARLNRRSSLVGARYAAAVSVQTAFRGYLARRALRALKGIVKLQALIRGENTRKQAKTTLRCMQALIRVQTQICEQQQRPSRKSMFAETNNLWDRYMQDIRQRKSTSVKERSNTEEWDGFPCIFEEDEAMIAQGRKDASLKSDKTLAYALSQQIRRSDSARSLRTEKEANERTDWLNQWMTREEATTRGSIDRRDSFKTIQMDTTTTTAATTTTTTKTATTPKPHTKPMPMNQRRDQTPPQSRHSLSHTRPLEIRSASPRLQREERNLSTTNTPSLRSTYSYTKGGAGPYTPRYMAATESARAKAKARSVSTPKQRPFTPSRDRGGGSARKRLSYPIHEYGSVCTDSSSFTYSLRSPSFRSVCPAIERGNYHSYYGDSACGEVSPASTTQIRRWLS